MTPKLPVYSKVRGQSGNYITTTMAAGNTCMLETLVDTLSKIKILLWHYIRNIRNSVLSHNMLLGRHEYFQ